MTSIFSNQNNRDIQKFEELFAQFKRDYKVADQETKRQIVNALLADVAGQLENYIHCRNKPHDVETGTVLSRAYLSVSKYFTDGGGSPEHYETGRQFILLLKQVVSQSICARIRQYIREHGGESVDFISIDGSQNSDPNAGALDFGVYDEFEKDLERRELVEILCQKLAEAKRGESSRLSPSDHKLLELRYKEGYVLAEIADYFDTNTTDVRRRLARVLEQLEKSFKEIGVVEF